MDYFEKHLFSQPQIEESPSSNLGVIVTIPCFNEVNLLRTLDSLKECDRTQNDVEVIVHFNSSEESLDSILKQNQKTIEEFYDWKSKTNSDKIKFHLIHSPALPKKHAGVGLARKIVMDEAAWRFLKIKNTKGVIVCLDADCTVEKNYLEEIENHFLAHPNSTGCCVYFEHPLEGTEFDAAVYSSIINYELFLRYYMLGLKYSGFPYPYDTIGSCMAVRADVYMKQGGMNRRQAGEDFYFLHKIFPLENFNEIKSTTVIPSPRLSNRVPFGTGADIAKQIGNGRESYKTYHPESFHDLKIFFKLVPSLYSKTDFDIIQKFPESIVAFLKHEPFEKKLAELRQHTASQQAFVKRFFKWFDGFKLLKYIHFARDHFYPPLTISDAVHCLLRKKEIQSPASGEKELLMLLRKMELENNSSVFKKNKQEIHLPEADILPV